MSNSFCKFLSNGLFISDKIDSDNLMFSPCCLYTEGNLTYAKDEWNKINDWTNNCNQCQVKETSGKNSHRQIINNWFHDVSDNNLRYLEIDYSNACNAACGMCKPIASSSIAKIWRDEKINFIPVPNVKREVFYEVIENLDFKNIKVIKFRGGEPFYSNFHKKILKKVVLKEETIVMYHTNGSIYPDNEWWSIAKNFKNIHFSFSIDGTNERFDYIRTNLKYEKVKNNIIKLITNPDINSTCDIEATINPLNAFYYNEIFDLLLELKKYNKNITMNWHQCRGDWGLENTPPQLRNIITEKYKNNNLCQMINNFPFEKENFINFVKSIKKHESRFNFDTNKTFPEIYPLIIQEYEKLITF